VDPAADGRNETEKERLDRNLNELLGGLRVVLPGVQVLFAFLLAVPFNQRFSHVSGFGRDVYFVTLLLTALASALLIAPSAYHRIQFRRDDKRQVVMVANRLAIIGVGVLACAMTCVILLVTDFLFGIAVALPTALGAAITFGSLWYAMPLARRRRISGRRPPRPVSNLQPAERAAAIDSTASAAVSAPSLRRAQSRSSSVRRP
jgi:Family of unknown function (DUF6328)